MKANTLILLTLSLHFLLLLEGNVVQNESKSAHVYFTDREGTIIPMTAVEELFTLPPSYHCSSIVNPFDSRSSQLKTFFVKCKWKTFAYFLGSIHHLIMKFKRTHINLMQLSTYNDVSIYRANPNPNHFSFLSSFEDFQFLYPILQKFFQNEEFLNWLGKFNERIRSVVLDGNTVKYFKYWNSKFKYAIAVTFLEDLYFQIDDKKIALTRQGLLHDWGKNITLGSGNFGTCHRVRINESLDCPSNLKRHILKAFKKSYSFEDISNTDFREYSVLQKDNIGETDRYSTALSVVVMSFNDYSPIGYLMEEAENGDLESFLLQRHGVVLSKNFVEQLFELAKAIENLHRNGILHLDVKLNNIFVKSKQSNNSHNDYELILGDFGAAREIGDDVYYEKEFQLYAYAYPPELFCSDLVERSIGTHSDWYEYGKLLNQIASVIVNPDEKRKFIFMYSVLINSLTVSEVSKRWDYEKVFSFLQNLLSNYEENLICLHIPLTRNDSLPYWFLKPKCFIFKRFLRLTDKFKSCPFENRLLPMNPTSNTIVVPAHSTRRSFTMKIPVIYVFHQDFPYKIQMLQTNHEKFYFHRNSFLIFQPGCFCYAIIYRDDKCLFSITTYKYEEIIDTINSLQKDTLFPMNAGGNC